MKVSIQFRGPIARELNGGLLNIEIDEGTTLNELFSRVLSQNSYLQGVWREPREIDRDSMILRNDVDIGVTGGLKTILSDGDKLTILPLVHGG